MVDAAVSNTVEVKLMWVRVPPPALFLISDLGSRIYPTALSLLRCEFSI